jgi:beta-lactamase superfamily II metal-dependent hydrolase
MPVTHTLRADIATIWSEAQGGHDIRTVALGHPLDVEAINERSLHVRLWKYQLTPEGPKPVYSDGYIRLPKGTKPDKVISPVGQDGILKLDFIDVQQGDAAVMETPSGQVVLFDAGETQLFARHLARRYPDTTEAQPKQIDAIVVSHGDADHFAGLAEIADTEMEFDDWRQLFIQPKRVFTNGLVKRPSTRDGKSLPDKELLGNTQQVEGGLVITDLFDDLLDVPASDMNRPFQAWRRALDRWNDRSPVEFKRLALGQDSAFDFLANDGIDVSVLGPIETLLPGDVPGLSFLHDPPKGPRVNVDSLAEDEHRFTGALSASHTINGHSVVLRLQYGNVRFLLTGDLNEEAGELLLDNLPDQLEAEVLKVPHHGSADFSAGFIDAVAPVVSVVSSGDESVAKEYIHPRATLVAALGKSSRVAEPVVFITELAAFFSVVGSVRPESHVTDTTGSLVLNPKALRAFFAFQRLAFGAVRVRTDGRRLLVYTDSAKATVKEAYAYEVDSAHRVRPVAVVQF